MIAERSYRIRGLDLVINVEWLIFESGEYFAFDSIMLDIEPMDVLSQYAEIEERETGDILETENLPIAGIFEDSEPKNFESKLVAPIITLVTWIWFWTLR